MGLFDRNRYDRDFGARGGAFGNRQGGGMRGMWNRAENGVRDAFDMGGYDREYGARQNPSWGGDSYGGSSLRGSSFDRDDALRAGRQGRGSYDQDFGGGYSSGGGSLGRYDAGYRSGGAGWGGHDRGEGLGDRMRQGWHRLSEGVRDTFDRDDRDLGYRGSPNGNVDGGLSRDNLSRGGYGAGRTGYGSGLPGYDRDMGARDRWTGSEGGMGRGYDRDLGGTHWMDRDNGERGYGAGSKSREQTDAGDPFGDRANRTPIRMIRGGFRGGSMGIDYDRPYKQGIGDEPYYSATDFDRGGMQGGGMQGGAMGGYDRNFRNNRDDRNDWF